MLLLTSPSLGVEPNFLPNSSEDILQKKTIIEKQLLQCSPKYRARICKRLRSPAIDSKESIPPM